MERLVALVEGHTETHFVRATYGNAIVQRPFPNGKSVTLDLIAECIIDALATVGSEITKVLILLDREERDMTSMEMTECLRKKLVSVDPAKTLYIGIADRQIENWILADENFIRGKFGLEAFFYVGDGSFGKKALTAICGHSLRGPRDKALLLKETSTQKSRLKSASLAAFVSVIDFDWYWAFN